MMKTKTKPSQRNPIYWGFFMPINKPATEDLTEICQMKMGFISYPHHKPIENKWCARRESNARQPA